MVLFIKVRVNQRCYFRSIFLKHTALVAFYLSDDEDKLINSQTLEVCDSTLIQPFFDTAEKLGLSC